MPASTLDIRCSHETFESIAGLGQQFGGRVQIYRRACDVSVPQEGGDHGEFRVRVVTMLDRLLHHADVTVIEGDSYRVRESEQETAARRRKK